ncbi:MAG: endo alpha-1,4 polygalactosaminidase [Actinobacteria bacterium]|nr:endo alpha-1,4 polygalactosaminidase [Actinomycetota bacterium]
MRNRRREFALLATVLLIAALLSLQAGCDDCKTTADTPDDDLKARLTIGEVETWAYQLQGLSEAGAVRELEESVYDMLVLEPTRTDWSSDDRKFDTASMVETLKASAAGDGEHRKLVLAYLDIGEAEDWRWYWEWSRDWEPGAPSPPDWPEFILAPDPDGWEGNYPVAYWEPAWKDIIIYGENMGSHADRDYRSAMDEILRDGFDGVYLDWVEGYQYIPVALEALRQDLDPAQEMVDLIQEIGEYAHERDPDFLVVQQNAAALASEAPEILGYIDAIAQEAIWYDGEAFDDWDDPEAADVAVDPQLTMEYLRDLDDYMEAGLPVFDCEYAVEYAAEAYTRSRDQGFIPYCTRRALSRLTSTPPPD